MARAMVLAAGLGTRLRPLTTELPKALVPIGDRPLAAHIAGRLERLGFSEIVMNTHHLADVFPSQISSFHVKVHLVHEARIRGTAGGIAGARALLGPGPIVAWNADILVEPPVEALLEEASARGLALAVAPRPVGEGTVGVGAGGDVVRLRGRVYGREAAGGDYVGVAALGDEVLAGLPSEGCLVADVTIPRLGRGEPVRAVAAPGPWRDVGTLAEYLAANLAWLSVTHGPDASWVHSSATVSPAVRLERSIVGAHAIVTGEGVLAGSVVWPHARARAPLERAVVTTSGVVVHP